MYPPAVGNPRQGRQPKESVAKKSPKGLPTGLPLAVSQVGTAVGAASPNWAIPWKRYSTLKQVFQPTTKAIGGDKDDWGRFTPGTLCWALQCVWPVEKRGSFDALVAQLTKAVGPWGGQPGAYSFVCGATYEVGIYGIGADLALTHLEGPEQGLGVVCADRGVDKAKQSFWLPGRPTKCVNFASSSSSGEIAPPPGPSVVVEETPTPVPALKWAGRAPSVVPMQPVELQEVEHILDIARVQYGPLPDPAQTTVPEPVVTTGSTVQGTLTGLGELVEEDRGSPLTETTLIGCTYSECVALEFEDLTDLPGAPQAPPQRQLIQSLSGTVKLSIALVQCFLPWTRWAVAVDDDQRRFGREAAEALHGWVEILPNHSYEAFEDFEVVCSVEDIKEHQLGQEGYDGYLSLTDVFDDTPWEVLPPMEEFSDEDFVPSVLMSYGVEAPPLVRQWCGRGLLGWVPRWAGGRTTETTIVPCYESQSPTIWSRLVRWCLRFNDADDPRCSTMFEARTEVLRGKSFRAGDLLYHRKRGANLNGGPVEHGGAFSLHLVEAVACSGADLRVGNVVTLRLRDGREYELARLLQGTPRSLWHRVKRWFGFGAYSFSRVSLKARVDPPPTIECFSAFPSKVAAVRAQYTLALPAFPLELQGPLRDVLSEHVAQKAPEAFDAIAIGRQLAEYHRYVQNTNGGYLPVTLA